MYTPTCWQLTHDIDGAKNGAKWQMLPNVGPTFSNMLLTCRPTHQCCVKIGDAKIQQTQLRWAQMPTMQRHGMKLLVLTMTGLLP